MKQWQAVLCLVIIILTGIIIVAICKNTKTNVPAAKMPQPEIIWNSGVQH